MMDGTVSVDVIVGVEGLIVDVATAGAGAVTILVEICCGVVDVETGAPGEQAANIRLNARPIIHIRLKFSRLTVLS